MQAYFWDKRISQKSREKARPSEYSGCLLGDRPCISNSFSPLTTLFDTVLFPIEDTNLTERFSTEQMVSSDRPKYERGSNPVLHSIKKTHKKDVLSISDQIPEHIYTCHINQNWELIDVGITPGKSKDFQVIPALLDSGANATFIDKDVTEWMGLPLEVLTNPICIFNIDGSCNSARDVTHAVNITINFLRHREELHAEVTSLKKNSLILGYTVTPKTLSMFASNTVCKV